jgi:DNA-binding Xre family transcriptional regulator
VPEPPADPPEAPADQPEAPSGPPEVPSDRPEPPHADSPSRATSLASIRRRQLLSQRALAARAGVALSTIYLLEAGKTDRVTFKVMRAVSHALGVPADSIAEFRRAMDASSSAG